MSQRGAFTTGAALGISGDWLTFLRGRCCRCMKLFAFNLRTGEKRRLARSSDSSVLLQPGEDAGHSIAMTSTVPTKGRHVAIFHDPGTCTNDRDIARTEARTN